MRVLIIEDDANKMRRIANEVQRTFSSVVLTEARSYQSGVRNLMLNDYDFILLDMSLPIFDITNEEDGFQVDPFSGRNILEEMQRKNVIVPTVVITMFETFGEGGKLMTLQELNDVLSKEYPTIFKGVIYYNSSEINWKETLSAYIEEYKK